MDTVRIMRWLVVYLLLSCLPVHADVFKCVDGSHGVKYQEEACSQSGKQSVLLIAPTPKDQVERAIEERRLVEQEYESMLSSEAKRSSDDMDMKKKQLEIMSESLKLQNQQLQNYNLQNNVQQQRNYTALPIIMYPYNGNHDGRVSNRKSQVNSHPLLHPEYHGINLGLPEIN